MSDLLISEDIIPLDQFKTKATQFLKSINDTNRSIVITQNGKPSAVVLSPSEFDRLRYQSRFINAIQAGLADVEAGRVVDDDMLDQILSGKQTR